MSDDGMRDDELRERLDRLAGAVPVPGGAVGRVRAEVARRRRRRRTTGVVAGVGATAAALVIGVSVLPGTTFDDAAPPADEVPSVDPDDPSAGAPELGPEGLAGLVLGEPVDDALWQQQQLEREDCYRQVTGTDDELRRLQIGTVISVGVDDDSIVSLTLHERSGRIEAAATLPATWLGPTLGDPLADAVALPGAEVVVEDPRGPDGPGVTSVVIPTDAGVVVFADPPYDQATPAAGRISHITVRPGDEVPCRLYDVDRYLQPGTVIDPDAPVATFDEGGADGVRLGEPVAPAVDDGRLVASGSGFDLGVLGSRVASCDAWTSTDGSVLGVLTDTDGVVVAVTSGLGGGAFRTSFGVAPGQPLDEVADLVEAEPPPGTVADDTATGVPVDAELAPGVRVEVLGRPTVLPIRTIDAVLTGELQVDGVTVYLGGDDRGSLC